jgi:hypothetical protein
MKRLTAIILLFIPMLVFTQDKKPTISVMAQYSNAFEIKDMNFNKIVDPKGKGEILQVEFILYNKTDEPIDLYIFTIATYEQTEKTRSSLEMPIPPAERVRNFCPFPYELANFQYNETDSKGNPIKDANGHEKVVLLKQPKDTKKGVNPLDGKIYTLKDRLVVRTLHLSPYKNNYIYYNEIAILIFDKEGNPSFRQFYTLKGKRR